MRLLTFKFKVTLALLLFTLSAILAYPAQSNQTNTIKYLEKGTTIFQGRVETGLWLAYRFNLKAGQQLSVNLKSEKGKAHFTLLTGKGGDGISNEDRLYADNAANVTTWSDQLRKTGEYEIEVKAAADEPATFSLEVTVK